MSLPDETAADSGFDLDSAVNEIGSDLGFSSTPDDDDDEPELPETDDESDDAAAPEGEQDDEGGEQASRKIRWCGLECRHHGPRDVVTGQQSKRESLLFPRYHQWESVSKLVAAARSEGPGGPGPRRCPGRCRWWSR